jgi:hypothetical protein
VEKEELGPMPKYQTGKFIKISHKTYKRLHSGFPLIWSREYR